MLGVRVSDDYARSQRLELWDEHLEAWELFLAVQTQWRIIAGLGGARYQGIDYTALESVMRMRGVADQGSRLDEVRHIEAGALAEMNN